MVKERSDVVLRLELCDVFFLFCKDENIVYVEAVYGRFVVFQGSSFNCAHVEVCKEYTKWAAHSYSVNLLVHPPSWAGKRCFLCAEL